MRGCVCVGVCNAMAQNSNTDVFLGEVCVSSVPINVVVLAGIK